MAVENWTKCSEALPSKVGKYFCLYSNGAVHEREFTGKSWLSAKDKTIRGKPIFWKERGISENRLAYFDLEEYIEKYSRLIDRVAIVVRFQESKRMNLFFEKKVEYDVEIKTINSIGKTFIASGGTPKDAVICTVNQMKSFIDSKLSELQKTIKDLESVAK